MKKLYVCGCSFNTVSKKIDYKDTHWSQVLSKKLGWELVNLAKPGISNGGIRLQIDKAIKDRADFVIVVATVPDRIELSSNIAPSPWFSNKEKNFIGFDDKSPEMKFTTSGVGYDPELGLDNIDYTSSKKYRLISAQLRTLISGTDHYVTDKAMQVLLKQYIAFMYDPLWKKQLDSWLMVESAHTMYDNDIPFFLDPGYLWTMEEFKKVLPKKIDKKHFSCDETETLKYCIEPFVVTLEGDDDPGYHSLPEQQKVIANIYYNIIKNGWEL